MTLIRPLAAASLTGALVLLGAPAFAHVTVNPNTAQQGGYTKLTFRVPDESDTASTTKVQVAFPSDHPIASVMTKAVPGWTAKVETTKPSTPLSNDDGPVTEVVSQITWTADSAASAIKPGQFGEFDVSVGPLPEVSTVTFKALQTYSDGTVVRWIDTATGSTEPDHPAPVLTLTPAGSTASPSASAGTSGTTSATDTAASSSDSESDDDSKAPLIVSIVALVVAVLGAGIALSKRRRA
ncbi:YcnI family protein [Nocardioides sp.]|uniref:YcnI family copper-binding membrane protein n=1 Tax=Nocardioides sp. TaxID=35761 RepID=UPI0026233DBF|nr:YcnI family protein [Nocardioides sp.]